MLDLESIIFERGLGSLLFGCDVSKIEAILGMPNGKCLDMHNYYSDEIFHELVYDQLKLKLIFDYDYSDGLVDIYTQRETIILSGVNIYNKPQVFIHKLLQETGKLINEPRYYKNYEKKFEEGFEYDEFGLRFAFMNHKLIQLHMFSNSYL